MTSRQLARLLVRSDARTPRAPAAATRPAPPTDAHEHGWVSESRHRCLDGWVVYVRCACGARRVDLQAHPATPPAAMTGDIG